MKSLILTYTGKHVNLLDFQSSDVDLLDIAHALACCNRFAGHCQRPISVAQHSVYVSRLCKDTGYEAQALLHDASEAYLGDVTKWLKQSDMFQQYREIEQHIQEQIFLHFHCPHIRNVVVDVADKLMLRFEGERAFGYARWQRWAAELPDYPIVTQEEIARIGPWAPWDWHSAQDIFLSSARMLGLNGADPIQERVERLHPDRLPRKE